MSRSPQPDPADFAAPPYPYLVPRISGTAMPTGVFLSTGTVGTARAHSLILTGFALISLGMLSAVPSYLIVWLADQYLHLSLTAMLLQVGAPSDAAVAALARVGINLVTFVVFLTLLRQTPLAGYHAAEHMTVNAIEQYGIYQWEAHVPDMSPVHSRCGSNLLAGVLPTLLIGVPLFAVQPLLTLAIVLVSWRFRHVAGGFIQRTFTTKPPTPLQLQRGMDAGRRLLADWVRMPAPRLSIAQQLWRRGVPQLVAGVVLALYLFGRLGDHLPTWLDW
jgi:hypothetical protein